jgi:hypothetical protein
VASGSARALNSKVARLPTAKLRALTRCSTLVTSLDRIFLVAYRFGAIFLASRIPPDWSPDLPFNSSSAASNGTTDDGNTFEDIGFVYYWWIKDYQKAAEWFKRAGEQPGAPAWLEPLAATTLAQGGDRQSSRLLWTQLLASDVEWLRNSAQLRLRQLDAMDQIDELNRRIQEFEAREKKRPTDWRQVGLPSAPLDPTGTPYRVNPKTGLVDLGPGSILFPLPR